MANSYALLDEVRLSGAFRNLAGALADPTTITVKVRQEVGDVETFTYAGAQVVREDVGLYYLDYTPTRSGRLYYRFIGTGIDTVAETYLIVLPSGVLVGQ